VSKSTAPLAVVNRVDLIVEPSFWISPTGIWAGLIWLARRRHPDLNWARSTLVGGLGTVILIGSDVGHALAHTISARLAGAPMDRIVFSLGMPRTLYDNDNVPPRAHIIRSTGGPVFNAIGLGLSLLWRAATIPKTPAHDLALLACSVNGALCFVSLVPLPNIDGGVLLKWGLVARGATLAQADQAVHTADLALALILAGTGLAVFLTGRRRIGAGLLAAAALVAVIDAGLLR
jgi:hypothetical protein